MPEGYPSLMKEAQVESCRSSAQGRHLHLGETGALVFHVSATADAPQQLINKIKWLDVHRSARYRPDDNTYCNIYAFDYCYLNNVNLPILWNVYEEKRDMVEKQLTSADIFHWLQLFGSDFGWRNVRELTELQALANEGVCCLIVGLPKSPKCHGHISIVAPETSDVRAIRSGQVVLCPVQTSAGAKLVSLSNDYRWFEAGDYGPVEFWCASPPSKSLRHELTKASGIISRIIEKLLPSLIDEVCARMIVLSREARQLGSPGKILERALVCAEDRRFYCHTGFDPKGIARAAWIAVTRRGIQGASTIEQQLIRTLTRRRDLSLGRKATEILAAIWLSANFPKSDITNVYLRVAYYGWRMNGLEQARARLGMSEPIAEDAAADLVACLRYPRPREPNLEYDRRHRRRASYIRRRIEDVRW